jgi:sialic acid synthase SpsE
MEPKEFAGYVKLMRDVNSALGVGGLNPSPNDLEIRKGAFRRIVANKDIPIGTVLTEEMLECKRPETGLSPGYLDKIIGRKTKRSLKYNDAISLDDVDC